MVPETVAENVKESPARIFAVVGATVTVIESGGGGGALVLRVVAEHPAMVSITSLQASWRDFRISEDTHREPRETQSSVKDEKVRRYWTEGQYLADVREKKSCTTAIRE